MSDQEAMAAMAAQQGSNAAGPATNMQVPPSYPTGMSMPTNPVGYAGTDTGSWYDNLFKGGNWDPKNFDQKKWGALGSLGQMVSQSQQPRGALAAPMMGGGAPVQPTQRQAPVLALIHPSTRIY